MEETGDVRRRKRKQHLHNTEAAENHPHSPPHKRRRRRRVKSESKTLTRESDPPPPPSSSRFQLLSPSYRKHTKRQPSRTETESSREWASSPCSSSASAYGGKQISNSQMPCLANLTLIEFAQDCLLLQLAVWIAQPNEALC